MTAIFTSVLFLHSSNFAVIQSVIYSVISKPLHLLTGISHLLQSVIRQLCKGRICCRLTTTTRRPSVLTTHSRTRIGQECLKYPIILFPAFCCFLLLLYILLSPPPPQPFDQHRSSNTKHLIQRHLQSHYRPLQLHSFCPTSPLHCSALLLAALRCCL